MNSKPTAIILTAAAAGILLWLSGCGSPATPASNNDENKFSAALPAGLILKEAPPGAKDIGIVKKDAKEGDEIVVRGVVAGRKEIFTAGRAMLILADLNLETCKATMPDCKTPWDFCVNGPEKLAANTMTVQILGGDGKVLKTDVKGISGIDYFSVLVVKGKVARREGDNLVLNANGIFVEKTGGLRAN